MRTKSVKIWLTVDEHAELQRRQVGGQLATWMRETCLGQRTKRRNPPSVEPALLRQLAGIGNNLNQIARRANKNLNDVDAVDLLIRLDAIEQSITRLRSDYDSKNP